MEYKAYSFDLDDNLLKLPTLIYLKDEDDNVRTLTTLEFENVRDKLEERGLRIVADSFRDFLDDKQFLIDISKSTKAGSWENLVNCVVHHASIFAIITARGHGVEVLRAGVKACIVQNFSEEQLGKFVLKFGEKYKFDLEGKSNEEILDVYLGLCKFYPVNNVEIKKRFGSEDTSELKSLAFENFQDYVKDYVRAKFGKNTEVKIGFSDDSIVHLRKMVNDVLKKHGLFFYRTGETGKTGFI